MLTNIFGFLGQIAAPSPGDLTELSSLVRGNQNEDALTLLIRMRDEMAIGLKDSDTDILDLDRNLLDGMNVLHLSCWNGALAIVVELISLGVDVNAVCSSSDSRLVGCRPLHFASIGCHKHVVDVLMRSGADPSYPNEAGQIPYDLTTDTLIRNVLLSDRDDIVKKVISPMQQARQELALSPSAKEGEVEAEDTQTGHEEIDAMTTGIERIAISSSISGRLNQDGGTAGSPPKPLVPKLDFSKLTPRGPAGMNSPGAIAPCHDQLPPMPRRGVDSDETNISIAMGNEDGIIGMGARSSLYGEREAKPGEAAGALTKAGSTKREGGSTHKHIYSNSPRVDYSYIPSVPPPPTDSELAESGSQGSRSTSSMMYRESDSSCYTGSDSTNSYDFDRGELEAAVLLAATETSAAYLEKDLSYDDRLFLFKSCQPPPKDAKQLAKTLDKLRTLLDRRPALVNSRCIELGNLGKDGQTMLHAAAANNNLPVMTLLLNVRGVSTWVRDLQGRTPLHCAAENVTAATGNIDICRVLRERMAMERPSRDPVGHNAPLDLAGRTPLGRQNRERVAYQPSKEVQEVLFADGDKSVLPRSPINTRSGHSPIKGPNKVSYAGAGAGAGAGSASTADGGDTGFTPTYDAVYAFSEASGWRHYMEDRILAACPLVKTVYPGIKKVPQLFPGGLSEADSDFWNAVGIFGVCDGHGGSFVSQYLVDELPAIMLKELQSARQQHQHQCTPDMLQLAMIASCMEVERSLCTQPRMAVDLKPINGVSFNESTGQPLNPKPCDISGSTGVFCLITPSLFGIANVGDSRALVASFRQDGNNYIPDTLSPPSSNTAATTPATGKITSPFALNANPYGNNHLPLSRRTEKKRTVNLSWATMDHKCDQELELKRIQAAGLTVTQHSSGGSQMKVGSETISMSRSFADFAFKQNKNLPAHKQALIAVPDVYVFERSARDAFIVLACDGIFDVMSNEEVVAFFAASLGYASLSDTTIGTATGASASEEDSDKGTETGFDPNFVSPVPTRSHYSDAQRPPGVSQTDSTSHMTTAACDALLKECLRRGSGDNMSVLLIILAEPGCDPSPSASAMPAPVHRATSATSAASAAAVPLMKETSVGISAGTSFKIRAPPPPPIGSS